MKRILTDILRCDLCLIFAVKLERSMTVANDCDSYKKFSFWLAVTKMFDEGCL